MASPANTKTSVRTRVLILSDTHSLAMEGRIPPQPVDVAIHCGDLTQGSRLCEFDVTLQLLRALQAPLKLVIAGNHDFTLDEAAFRRIVKRSGLEHETALVEREYGAYGEARRLFAAEKHRQDGIRFLDEGTHRFPLANGALLTVFATPYTPCFGDWGFQFSARAGHAYAIEPGTNIAITHGPPLGLLDQTARHERAGCAALFASVARARPQVHCFGHIHAGWGAEMVTWQEQTSEQPSCLTDVDNEKSRVLETLSTLQPSKGDTPGVAREKAEKLQRYTEQRCCSTSHCRDDEMPLAAGRQTLFVNAAIEGSEEMPVHLPWLIELELPGR